MILDTADLQRPLLPVAELVIDRLGRTIAELEARNAALEQQLQAAAAIKCGCVPLNLDPKPGTPIPEVPQ